MLIQSTFRRAVYTTLRASSTAYRNFASTSDSMAQIAGKKHARSDSQTHDDYVQVQNQLKHPSTKRAKQIDADPPYDQLEAILKKTRRNVKTRNVLHWFRSKDIRQEDNKGLHAAAQKAKEGGGSLISMYLFSPKDMEWHGTSPARSDFILECLRILKSQLEEKNIPLAIITAEERGNKTDKVMQFAKENDISHIFANMEYEVDELRRDVDLAKKVQGQSDISLDVLHDQTVIVPGSLCTGAGGPHKVFTRYYNDWLAITKKKPNLIDTCPPPEGNDKSAKQAHQKLFDSTIPTLPESKQFGSDKERDQIRKLWPAGNKAGMQRHADFLKHKIANYAANRSEAALDPSSRLSPYFSSGIVSVREILRNTQKFNQGKDLASGDAGVVSWVREIVFREFYRQVTVITPHTSMNLPQNLKFDFVHWEDDEEGWKVSNPSTIFLKYPNADSTLPEMVRRPHRHPLHRRRHAPAQHRSLHAQPPAHEHGLLPPRKLPNRLPHRRALLCRAPHRLGHVEQHAGLGTELHGFQPRHPGREARSEWGFYQEVGS